MTQLPSSSEILDPSPTSEHNPQPPTIQINDEPIPQPSPQIGSEHLRTSTTRKPHNTAKRPSLCTLWCRAGILTILVVFAAYVWLSWTDPDQVEMRQMAWDAAMEKIRGKQVVHAQRSVTSSFLANISTFFLIVDGEFGFCRYSEQYRFRPAASPIITETLPDGRKKVRGGRHGDDIPMPKPTGTAAVQAKKKERRRRSKKKN
jgi:hypothetical protein